MPMYVYLLENQNEGLKKHISNCAFFNVKDGVLVPVIGSLLGCKEDKKALFEKTQERFLRLAEYYAQCVENHSIDVEGIAENWQGEN